jgi:predicted Fe-Mo cluster-binding NifX family protein
MRIAISTDGDRVAEHFGRCPSYTITDIEDGTVLSRNVIDNPGHQPGFLPKYLREQGVACVIAGGMGHRAVQLFRENGIETVVGITGKIDEVLEALLAGTLEGGESLCSSGGRGQGHGPGGGPCDHHSQGHHHEHERHGRQVIE